MSLTRPSTGNTIAASHVDQLVDVLQRSSGQTETGKYQISAGIYTNGASNTFYYASLSRGATPVSVSINSADTSLGQMSGVSTADLTANGFQVFGQSTTSGTNGKAGGNITISF